MSHLAPHLQPSPFPFFFLSILSVLRFLSELLELIFWVNEHLAEKDLLCSRNHSLPRWKQPYKRPPSQKCFERPPNPFANLVPANSNHCQYISLAFSIKCCLFTANLPVLTTQEEKWLCTRLRNQDSSPSHTYEWVFPRAKLRITEVCNCPSEHQRHKHPVWPPQTSP